MAEPAFRGVVTFLEQIGVYEVVLPFLLVFTIVFAILEKTKVLGTEEIEGTKYTKKNLNAIMAFVIGFLVVASTNLVRVINEAMANMVLLLLLSVSFLLLIGSFLKEDQFPVFLEKGPWRTMFMFIMFIGIIAVFLGAFDTGVDWQMANGTIICLQGSSWLLCGWNWLELHWQTNFVATILLLIFIVIFMKYIVSGAEPPKPKKEEK